MYTCNYKPVKLALHIFGYKHQEGHVFYWEVFALEVMLI